MFALKKKPAPSKTRSPGNEIQSLRHERQERKEFRYYMKLFDDETQELVGHLSDINSGGFKLDCQNPIPINKNIRFLVNLTSEVANKPRMIFGARSRWCKVDPFDPFSYNVGFQLTEIFPEDCDIFIRLMEKYGTERDNKPVNLRRTNLW